MVHHFEERQKTPNSSLAKTRQRLMVLLKKYPSISSISILLCANVINNLVTFIVNIFLAKKFGPENFGVFSLAVSILMAFSFVFDLGLSLTMVRFYNLYQKEEDRQRLLLSSLLIFRISVILLLIVLSFPVGFFLSDELHLGHSYQPLLSLAVISGAMLTLWLYFQNYLQAKKEFVRISVYVFAYAVLRIACVVILYFSSPDLLNNTSALVSLYLIPTVFVTLVGVIPMVVVFFRGGFLSISGILNTVGMALKYSKWVTISGISYNLILRCIQFILVVRSSKIELGIFSAGFVFTVAFSTLNVAVRTVFFPHVTSFEQISDMRSHITRVRKVFPYYTIVMVVSIALLAFIQVVFLGDEYATALPVFLISSIALTLSIFMGLVTMLLHTLMLPQVNAFVNVGQLVAAGVLVYFLCPKYGAIGGAIGYAIPVFLGELIMVAVIRAIIHEKT